MLLKEKYREKRVGELYEDPYKFELATKKIIGTHRPKIVDALATSDIYAAVIYGHTHVAVIEKRGNKKEVLVINPRNALDTSQGEKRWQYLI